MMMICRCSRLIADPDPPADVNAEWVHVGAGHFKATEWEWKRETSL
jgi:hypothetical protein